MLAARDILLIVLGLFAVGFCAVWGWELTRRKEWDWPEVLHSAIGFITDFLDTLGIGSFATTTSLYRMRHTVADEKIPGTLNVGHCIPTLVQAFIYITLIEVEMTTLIPLLVASVLGAWLGASVVTRLSRPRIQLGMGIGMLVLALLLVGKLLAIFPKGDNALGLDGIKLAIAIAGSFVLGALMTIGIGAYAPIMLMVGLLGMSPDTAFPIMMGSCAFLMPVASVRFIRSGAYDPRAALGLTLAGVPGVLLAAFIVKQLPIFVIGWLVVCVVIYTAVAMIRAAQRQGGEAVRAQPVLYLIRASKRKKRRQV